MTARWARVPVIVVVAALAAAGCTSTSGSTASAGSTSGGASSGTASSGAASSGTASSGTASSGPATPGRPGSGVPAAPSGASTQSTAPPAHDSASATRSAPDAGSSGAARRVFDGMSERERVGQLLMVDCPSTGVSGATRTAIENDHVGSVILDGTTTSGLDAVRQVTDGLQRLAPRGVGLLVATDQEGGEVQRLQGRGFSRIPSAVSQGGDSASALRSDATAWARQLRAAGVAVNLAPVLDTVPAGSRGNPPIGDLDREYGRTPAAVSSAGLAFAAGMAAAGVDATAKHFPGLGRVSGNTDTTSGVTDDETTRHDADLAPFRAAVRQGVPFVMMSTAVYARIDAHVPAAFSRTIVTGMLRGDLGFRGVIVSDDLGSAAQVGGYSVGSRAVDFMRAGGDLVLTVNASQAGTMTEALLARARSDGTFRRQLDAAALLVLQAKQASGLLG